MVYLFYLLKMESIKRKARVIPFGYKLADDTDYIEPVQEELDALEEAKEYMDELNDDRLANEEKNIQFTRDVSLATQKTQLPPEMKNKIMSYGLEDPKNPKDLYKTIKKLGGKSRNKSRRKSKRKSKRKSRRNKKNTRKHRE